MVLMQSKEIYQTFLVFFPITDLMILFCSTSILFRLFALTNSQHGFRVQCSKSRVHKYDRKCSVTSKVQGVKAITLFYTSGICFGIVRRVDRETAPTLARFEDCRCKCIS
jgi:hypothetical protein